MDDEAVDEGGFEDKFPLEEGLPEDERPVDVFALLVPPDDDTIAPDEVMPMSGSSTIYPLSMPSRISGDIFPSPLLFSVNGRESEDVCKLLSAGIASTPGYRPIKTEPKCNNAYANNNISDYLT